MNVGYVALRPVRGGYSWLPVVITRTQETSIFNQKYPMYIYFIWFIYYSYCILSSRVINYNG